MKILFSWVGINDFNHFRKDQTGSSITSLLKSKEFDKIILIHNFKDEQHFVKEQAELSNFKEWLAKNYFNEEIKCELVKLKDPTDLLGIKRLILGIVNSQDKNEHELFFNLSSGTWAMTWIWFFISETQSPAILLQSSVEGGVKEVSVPFEINGRSLFKNLRSPKNHVKKIFRIFDEKFNGEFQNYKVRRLIEKINKVAKTNLPVTIIGENGSPIDNIARSIFEHSYKKAEDEFISIDCFYYQKKSIREYFSKPNSTIYIKNIEYLRHEDQEFLIKVVSENNNFYENNPPNNQKEKLNIRVLFSSSKEINVLYKNEVFSSFFFDLISQIVLPIPPLRERTEDLPRIIDDHFLYFSNQYNQKVSLSTDAKKILQKFHWPGNERELDAALNQIVLFSNSSEVSGAEVMEVLFEVSTTAENNNTIAKPLEEGFNLKEFLNEESKRYIIRAETENGGNLKRMASALGFENHQTLVNRMKALGLKD